MSAPVRCDSCDELHSQVVLASVCHPDAGMTVLIDLPSDTLYVSCCECGAPVAKFHALKEGAPI